MGTYLMRWWYFTLIGAIFRGALNPKSTSLSGGPAIGFGAGLSIIGTWAWFKKVYSFSEAPGHLPLRAPKYP